jgi:hypothetical protein
VVAILKSGAYQDTKLENGEHVCLPTADKCVKIYAAAPGFEANAVKYSGTSGAVAVALKPGGGKSSAIIRRRAPLPGIDGDVSPILDNLNRLYMYGDRIGFVQRNRPALQPIKFEMRKPIDAVSPTGGKFKIWVVDITTAVSLLEFTLPK